VLTQGKQNKKAKISSTNLINTYTGIDHAGNF